MQEIYRAGGELDADSAQSPAGLLWCPNHQRLPLTSASQAPPWEPVRTEPPNPVSHLRSTPNRSDVRCSDHHAVRVRARKLSPDRKRVKALCSRRPGMNVRKRQGSRQFDCSLEVAVWRPRIGRVYAYFQDREEDAGVPQGRATPDRRVGRGVGGHERDGYWMVRWGCCRRLNMRRR